MAYSVAEITNRIRTMRSRSGKKTSKELADGILYYIQAWTLAVLGRRMFDGRIRATDDGVTVEADGSQSGDRLTGKDRAIVTGMVLVYSDDEPDFDIGPYLQKFIRTEEPWSEAVDGVIGDEAMASYYRRVMAAPNEYRSLDVHDVFDDEFLESEDNPFSMRPATVGTD